MALAFTAAVGGVKAFEGAASGIANQRPSCEVTANPYTWVACPTESGAYVATAALLSNEPPMPKGQS